MNFTERPTLLKNDPGNIRQNNMRCNSFELSAGDVTVQKVKLNPDVPSQQPGLFRNILAKAREELTTKVGQQMVFGTQLVGTQRIEQATAQVVVDDKSQTIAISANDSGDATRLKEMFLNNIFNRAQTECKQTQIARKFFDIGSKQQVDPEQGISVVTG